MKKCVPPSCTSLSQTGASPGAHFMNPGSGDPPQASFAQPLADLSEFAIGYTLQIHESALNLYFVKKLHAYFAQPLATLSGCQKNVYPHPAPVCHRQVRVQVHIF